MAEPTRDDAERVDAVRQTDEAIRRPPVVPELTEELLHTLPVPIAAAVHQLKITRDGERRRAEAAERRHSELRAELEQLRIQCDNERVAASGFDEVATEAIADRDYWRGQFEQLAAQTEGQDEVRAEVVRLRAERVPLTDEYGLLVHHLDTTTSEGAIASTLAEALEVLADFDASSGPGVLSRTLRVRPVGPWQDASEAGRG